MPNSPLCTSFLENIAYFVFFSEGKKSQVLMKKKRYKQEKNEKVEKIFLYTVVRSEDVGMISCSASKNKYLYCTSHFIGLSEGPFWAQRC